MAKKLQKQKYSWAEFDKDSKKIAAWARKRGFKNIYGVPRGGLVLAVRLSHLLDVPLAATHKDAGPETLFVDDTIDSGGTVERLFASLGYKFTLASIFFDKSSNIKPDFFVWEKERWVVFPWETEKTSSYDRTV